MKKEKSEIFKAGEYVVYPAQGVGVVQGIETDNIAGTKLKVLVILFEKDRMTIRLPLNGSTIKKVRALCTKDEMEKAINSLRIPIKTKKVMWSRRVQEYEAKIHSGDLMSVTQVVRDLHKAVAQPEHSYSERQIYQEAMGRLTKEYAAVAQIDEEQAMQKLQEALAA